MDVIASILQDRKIAYVVTDTNLKVVQVNDGMGLFNNKLIKGRSLPELVPEMVGNEPILADILAGVLPRFELDWINFELLNEETIYLTLVNLPHRNATGQITGLLHIVQDVTEIGKTHQQLTQHRNELQLLQHQLTQQNKELTAANAELRRIDEIKSNFISIAAHELNNPLGAIIGYVEMLIDEIYGPVSEKQLETLHLVHRAGAYLSTIIKDFLDVARIDAGRVELTLRPTDLLVLTDDVAVQYKPTLAAKMQQLNIEVQPDLPFALIDQTRTMQIMGNLLSNASKYTPNNGEITIELSLAKKDGFLQLSIADTGVGIATDDQKKLFSRFFRAKNVQLTGASGTGLGLYIARSLVELQGGNIWLESEINQGTTVYVTFPIAGWLTSG